MSGVNDVGICPNCGSDKYEISSDWKPFNLEQSQCYDCGFYTLTRCGIDNLRDLNELREESEWMGEELKPLKKPNSQTEWARENMKYYLNDCERGFSVKRLNNIAKDIMSDTEWVNDSHEEAEYRGVCSGLEQLIEHCKEVSSESSSTL